jgi:SAM-dependent methyltransferase
MANNEDIKLELKDLNKPTSSADQDIYQMVIWAYRLFLGREPENDYVISDKVSRLKSLNEVRKEFIISDEFQRNYLYSPIYNDDFGVIAEDTIDEHEQEILFKHIQKTWELLGKIDPHWSVLTSDAYKCENIHLTKKIFYDSGKEEVLSFFNTLKRNKIDITILKGCLEYGCGVGRVTAELSKHFNLVYGCDISKSHLEIAHKYFNEVGIKNIKLIQIKSMDDIINLPKVDLIYSRIVLQHNPPPIIRIIIRELIRALNPGGIAFFQVPTYRPYYKFILNEYLNKNIENQVMEMHILPQKEIFSIIEEERANVIEVLEDGWAGCDNRSNSFLIKKKLA